MLLEMCAPEDHRPAAYTCDLTVEDDLYIIKPQGLIRDIVNDLAVGTPREEISGRFHRTMVEALAEAVRRLSVDTGLRTVVLFRRMLSEQDPDRGPDRPACERRAQCPHPEPGPGQ